jgi:regulator of vacuolar morphogenesis
MTTTAIQSVEIREHEERSDPSPHIVYKINVQANVRSWSMWRRYSEFVDLHNTLIKSTGSSPPCQLPPKHSLSFIRSFHDPKVLEERLLGLEKYLRVIVSAKEEKWRECIAFREFLGVPVERQGGDAPTQFTITSWLGEHIELQSRIRDVRAAIIKRDSLADRGDFSAAHKSNVDAKQKLATIITRLGKFVHGLEELSRNGMTEGELQRRTDMVARLQDDCEKLSKVVAITQEVARVSGVPVTTKPALDKDREQLFDGASPRRPIMRVFGTAPPSKPQETDETRALDDVGIFTLQKAEMEQQDQHLSQLTSILHRQKHLGGAIGAELALQNELLDDLNENVDRVGAKLSTTRRRLDQLG